MLYRTIFNLSSAWRLFWAPRVSWHYSKTRFTESKCPFYLVLQSRYAELPFSRFSPARLSVREINARLVTHIILRQINLHQGRIFSFVIRLLTTNVNIFLIYCTILEAFHIGILWITFSSDFIAKIWNECIIVLKVNYFQVKTILLYFIYVYNLWHTFHNFNISCAEKIIFSILHIPSFIAY